MSLVLLVRHNLNLYHYFLCTKTDCDKVLDKTIAVSDIHNNFPSSFFLKEYNVTHHYTECPVFKVAHFRISFWSSYILYSYVQKILCFLSSCLSFWKKQECLSSHWIEISKHNFAKLVCSVPQSLIIFCWLNLLRDINYLALWIYSKIIFLYLQITKKFIFQFWKKTLIELTNIEIL